MTEKQIEEVMRKIHRYGDEREWATSDQDEMKCTSLALKIRDEIRTLLSSAQSGEQAPKFFFNPRDAERYHDGQSRFDCGSLPVSRRADSYYTEPLYTHPAPALEMVLDAKRYSIIANHWKKATFKYDRKGDLTSFVVHVDLAKEGLGASTMASTFDEALAVIAASQPNGESA